MTYRTQLLPDEPLAGYRGHICFHLDLSGSSEVTASLNARYTLGDSRAYRCPRPFIELASEITGQSVLELVRLHSMWPLLSAVKRGESFQQEDVLLATEFGKTDLFRTSRQRAWTCIDCQAEDLAFWGESYWRRAHQVPGQIKCPKHGVPLACCSRGLINTGNPDHAEATGPEELSTRDIQGSVWIDAFVEICSNILENRFPINQITCRDRLLKQLEGIWPGKSPDERAYALLEKLTDVFPLAWRSDLDRTLAKVKLQGYSGPVAFFRGSNVRLSTMRLALFMLTAFETADETLKAMTELETSPTALQ